MARRGAALGLLGLCVGLGAGAGPAPAGAAERRALTPAQIAERALPSVVLVRTSAGHGSGFIASADGKVVTNLHVISDASEAVVVLHDGREVKDIRVLGVDQKHDLVVLKVPGQNFPALPIGDSKAARAGEHVVAIGHPLGLGNTVSDGLISAVRVVDEALTLLQISAPIAPGSSGGPLLNDSGEVVAVATLASNRGQNLNFGMPVAYLGPLLASKDSQPLAQFLEKYAARRPAATFRQVPHHDTKVLKGCTDDDVRVMAGAISDAINLGAPLYNDGNHQACYRIYQGAALEIEEVVRTCPGLREALRAGRRRASGQVSYTERAWSMRDAFDGVLEVLQRTGRLPD